MALPAELDGEAREQLVRDLAAELVLRYGVVVDAAVHAPGAEGDDRNHHAHLLTSTRVVGPEGFGVKTRVLDAAKTGGAEITAMRAIWADLCNDALEAAGHSERIDPRAKGIQAAEATERALEAESEVEALEVVNGDVRSLSDLRRGLRAAKEYPSSLFTWKGAENAAERRSEAQEHRERAKRMSEPPERHRGPQRAARERKARERAVKEHEEAMRAFERRADEARRKRERQMAEQIEREEQLEVQRAEKVRHFVADWVEQAEAFPTPAQKWSNPVFRFSPEAMQDAAQKRGIELQAGEVRHGMARALRVWVARIADALPDLKPARSIWLAFTGGHAQAAQALRDALKYEPELGHPLRPAIETAERQEAEQQERQEARGLVAAPQPSAPKAKGPGNGNSGPAPGM